MPNLPDVSVIIVSYNTRELLRECIESLRGTGVPARAEAPRSTCVPARAEPPPSGTDNPVRAECSTGVPARAEAPRTTGVPTRAEPPPSGADNPVRAECSTGGDVRAAGRMFGTDRDVCATEGMFGAGGDAPDAEGVPCTDRDVRATEGMFGTGGDARATSVVHTGEDARATVEIIVVDNASSDGSAQMVAECFPEVKLIANPDNRGFGAACNQGLQIARGRYALILNADIRAVGNAIERLVQFMDTHPNAAACGGQLRYPDGRIQPSCARELTLWWVFCEQSLLAKLLPRTRLFGGYWRTDWDFSSTIETEQVMGACLMLRRRGTGVPARAEYSSSSREVHSTTGNLCTGGDAPATGAAHTGGDAPATGAAHTGEDAPATGFPLFDESYFLYCEDTDLCYRVRQAGGKIYYVHDAVFIHHLGASGEPQRAEMVIHYNKGKERYFRKFHGAWQARVCRWLNKMGALLRVLIGVGGVIGTLGRSERARRYAQTFWKVFLQS